jgi:chromosome segregation ATPase
MIESIMYFGGGFLVACLLAIILISFVHKRAVRLTQRRLEDAIPVSMTEIQADKDHLRAEFALNARRLEMSVDQLKAKVTAQLSEIARKNEAINLLKGELLEKTAVTDELAARVKALGGKVTQTEQESLEKVTALEATANTMAAKDAEIAHAASIIAALNHAADTQRVEIAVFKTQVEDLKSQIGDIQHVSDAAAQRLMSEQSSAEGVHKDLYQARQTIEMLNPQFARMEHEIASSADLIQDRDARIAEQNRMLYQLEADAQDLRNQLAAARNEITAAGERLTAARAAAEIQLRSANDVLSERSTQMRDLERRAADSERLAGQRDATAQALSGDIVTLKAESAAASASWADEKRAFETELAAREQTLSERARSIADAERRLGDFEHMVTERDAGAESLRQEISMLRGEATASAEAFHGHRTSLDGQIATAQANLTERAGRIQAFEQQTEQLQRTLSQRDGEVDGLRQEVATLRSDHDDAIRRWQAEKSKLDTELAALTSAAIERNFRVESLEHQLAEASPEAAKSSQDEIDPFVRAELASLRERSAATEGQLREANGRLTGDLKTARADVAKLNSEAETAGAELAKLNSEAQAAQAEIGRLNREAETAQGEIGRLNGEAEAARAEHARLNVEAESARNEHARLNDEAEAARAQVAGLQHEAESARKAEQSETALLREQISDIAAQIAQLTASPEKVEGAEAPMHSEATVHSEPPNGNGEAAPRHASLIERIRALQSRASRISPAP